MIFIRNIFFYIIFYIWTVLFFSFFSPVKFFTREFTVKLSNFWTGSVINLAKSILNIDFEVQGNFKSRNQQFILVSNHQSAWETFFYPSIFPNSVFVMKESLTKLPILNGYFEKLGYIPINRKKGYASTKKILKAAKSSLRNGANSIIIFPEGTRVDPDDRSKIHASGIFILYKYLNIPILVIKHNSGKLWRNKKFMKINGKINIKIFPVIKTGLTKEEMTSKINHFFS